MISFIFLLELLIYVASFAGFFYWRVQEPLSSLFVSSGFYFSIFAVLMARYTFGSFDLVPQKKIQVVIKSIFAFAASFALIVFANFLFAKERSGLFGRGVLFGSLGSYFTLATLLRLWIEDHLRKRHRDRKFTFLIDHESEFWLSKELAKNHLLGTSHFVDISQFQEVNELKEFVKAQFFEKAQDRLIVACDLKKRPLVFSDALLQFRFEGMDILDLASFYESEFSKLPVRYLSSQFLLTTEGFSLLGNPAGLRVKRMADVCLSFAILFFTWPIMLATALAIALESRGGVFYKQVRTGLLGETFAILKFRSMRSDAEKSGAQWAQQNDSRVTRVGKLIRLTRIDELPQIWNVLRGDMSFIGPRPERPEFNEMLMKQIPFYDLRHSVRPGLTGWAQVLYPYGASLDDAREKLQFDLYYIKNYSIWLDLSIIFKTVQVVLFGKGR